MVKQNEKCIAFSNEWFNGEHRIKHGGHYSFAVYGLLNYIEQSSGGVCTTIEDILNWFDMDTTNRRNNDKIKLALKYLVEHEVIVFYEDIKMRVPDNPNIDNIKNRTPLYINIKEKPQEKYTLITYTEFERMIYDTAHKGNAKVEMICYFSAIMSHINTKTGISFPSIELLKEEACIGKANTCSKYNKFLMVELNILRYQSSGKINPLTGTPYPTQYTRYNNEKALSEEIKRQKGRYMKEKLSVMLKENINSRTSISRKITNLNKQLDSLGIDAMRLHSKEYLEILSKIKILEQKRTELHNEYKELKEKRHLKG